MSNQIRVTEHRFHPDLPARADLDGASRHVVRPKVKGAAARQFNACMMPMAGQDAVLDAATLQRETHMRTAVVEREDAPIFVHEQDRAVAAVHNQPTLVFRLLKTACVHEIRGRGIHGRRAGVVSIISDAEVGSCRSPCQTGGTSRIPSDCSYSRRSSAGELGNARSAAAY